MHGAALAQRDLASELALAVNAERMRHVRLAIRRGACAVEDEIGRVVKHERGNAPRCFADGRHRVGIDAERMVAIVLGRVDAGIGRRVDDHVGHFAPDARAELGRIGKVDIVPSQRHDVAQLWQKRGQGASDLTIAAEQQQLHAYCSATQSR